MKFYCLPLKKSVNIADNLVKTVLKKNKHGVTKFAKGIYTEKGKKYDVYRIIGKVK